MRLIVCTLLATLIALPSIAEESTFNERVEIAAKIVRLDSPRDALINTSHEVKQHPMYNVVLSRLDFDQINEIASELLATNFTKPELDKLLDFLSTPEGQAITEKMGTYKKAIGVVVYDRMMRIIAEEQQKQQGSMGGGGFGGVRR